MNNITIKDFKNAENPEEVFRKVCHIGGFGDISPDHPGGLDISGLSEAKQKQIMDLVETTSSADADKKDEKKR